jgi:hypothetical protein
MGAGSVGSQALLGIARLQGLRERYGAAISVAPFEPPETQVVLAECYPGLFADMIAARTREGEIPDRAQVRVLAHALSRLAPDRLMTLLAEGDRSRRLDPRPWRGGRDRRRAALRPIAGPKTRPASARRPLR